LRLRRGFLRVDELRFALRDRSSQMHECAFGITEAQARSLELVFRLFLLAGSRAGLLDRATRFKFTLRKFVGRARDEVRVRVGWSSGLCPCERLLRMGRLDRSWSRTSQLRVRLGRMRLRRMRLWQHQPDARQRIEPTRLEVMGHPARWLVRRAGQPGLDRREDFSLLRRASSQSNRFAVSHSGVDDGLERASLRFDCRRKLPAVDPIGGM
jgi:hypothetical protein